MFTPPASLCSSAFILKMGEAIKIYSDGFGDKTYEEHECSFVQVAVQMNGGMVRNFESEGGHTWSIGELCCRLLVLCTDEQKRFYPYFKT